MSKFVALLLLVVLVSRLMILDWGLPSDANPAHEHSLFYDSHSTVRDQTMALRAVAAAPLGLLTVAKDAYMPLLQRYMATPFLILTYGFKYGFDKTAVTSAPFYQLSYYALFYNRIISVLSSVALLYMLIILLRFFKVDSLVSNLVAAVFAMNPVEIGISIHEKTIVLMALLLALAFYLLCLWFDNKKTKPFLLAAFFIGLAVTAREQMLYLGPFFFVIAILYALRRKVFKYFSFKLILQSVIVWVLGIAVGSIHLLFAWQFWFNKILHPGRSWNFSKLWETNRDLLAVLNLDLAGWLGVVIFAFTLIWLAVNHRRSSIPTQVLLVWILSYLVIFVIYPVKHPRFIQLINIYVFLGIGIFLNHYYRRGSLLIRKIIIIIGILWLGQTVFWGASALAFFRGEDNRLIAAREFSLAAPPGSKVATLIQNMHARSIPIDPDKYDLYSWDIHHSKPDNMLYIPSDGGRVARDEKQRDIGFTNVNPDYILIQYQSGSAWSGIDEKTMIDFRNRIRNNNNYELIKTYSKRTWRGYSVGVYSTSSRWTYLNPVVEVYRYKG